MVRPGLHPITRYYTMVLRNGATVQLPTMIDLSQPVFTDIVRFPLPGLPTASRALRRCMGPAQ